jgi:hypothetical protein
MRVAFLRCSWFLALGLLPLTARDAQAKERFVDVIATHLALPYQPPCRVCHIQGTTGPGSVQTPFGVSMLAHGLTSSQDTVSTALDGLAADMTDSDGDGDPDIDELRKNADPNTAAPVPLAAEDGPTYGCAVGPVEPVDSWGVLVGCLAGLALVGRRAAARNRGYPDGAARISPTARSRTGSSTPLRPSPPRWR